MPVLRAVLACLGVTLLLVLPARSQDPPPPLDPASAAERLWAEAQAGMDGLDYEGAARAAEAALAIERELHGSRSETVATTLEWLADLDRRRGEDGSARGRLAEALRIRTALHGAEHWKVTDARLALELAELRLRLDSEQLDQLNQAVVLQRFVHSFHLAGKARFALGYARKVLEIHRRVLGEEHHRTATSLYVLSALNSMIGEYEEAERLCNRALTIRKELLGEMHPTFATTLGNLADIHHSRGEFAEARACYLRALEIERETLGEKDPRVASSLNNLALLNLHTGDSNAAGPLFRQALEIVRDGLGEENPRFASSLNSLGHYHSTRGEYAEAEQLYRRALDTWRASVGEDHPNFAVTLNNLAYLHEVTGELAAAELLYRKSLEILETLLGKGHAQVAASLSNLAGIYRLLGEYARAEPLYRRALEIRRNVFGEEHELFAQCLGNLGHLHMEAGRYAKAEPLFRRVLEIQRKVLPANHPSVAVTLNNLAELYRRTGEFAAAEPLYRQALEMRGQVLGEVHPDFAASLHNLAHLHAMRGEFSESLRLYRRALDILRDVLDATFAVQSERRQILMSRLMRGTLNDYLAVAERTPVAASSAYAPVLAWKGAILARQVRARAMRGDPAVAGLYEEFESTSRRLAVLSLSVPTPRQREAWHRQRRELGEKREELEGQLSLKSEAYRGVRAAARLSPEELRGALPAGVALVDFLRYRTDDPRLVAFVVRATGEIARVDLGPAARISGAVDAWRAALPSGGGEKEGRMLRELVWAPIEVSLAGATTVLVSPDGPLSRLPFAALPGGKPGCYLLEEFSFAVVPVPQLLPDLLSPAPAPEGAASLLLVGDVDYGGKPGGAAMPDLSRAAAGTGVGSLREFGRLPATGAEIAAIRGSFLARHEKGRVGALEGSAATEAAFRVAAPNHRWLHLATHGFFAPPDVLSALAGGGRRGEAGGEVPGYHPGVLSGLALAGANRPPGPDGDDGILTAIEVASLDLSGVEVATLSACDTGLGEVAGGEGVLGLQRAFQVAGARTTVTSLWSVPDRATRALMARFYRNLWERRLPRAEALRQAQLWLLTEGAAEEDLRRGLDLPEGTVEAGGKGRLPPWYWAAFVLSGDWR